MHDAVVALVRPLGDELRLGAVSREDELEMQADRVRPTAGEAPVLEVESEFVRPHRSH